MGGTFRRKRCPIRGIEAILAFVQYWHAGEVFVLSDEAYANKAVGNVLNKGELVTASRKVVIIQDDLN